MKTATRPAKAKKAVARHSKGTSETPSGATGTYVYDAELGKIVKVSDRVPKVASHGGASIGQDAGPCGRSACAGGRCAGGSGNDF